VCCRGGISRLRLALARVMFVRFYLGSETCCNSANSENISDWVVDKDNKNKKEYIRQGFFQVQRLLKELTFTESHNLILFIRKTTNGSV
jgi:hypothetical protein